MLRIAQLNYSAPPETDAYCEFEAFGQSFEVQRFGFDGRAASLMESLLSLRNQVDAFALSGLPPVFRIKERSYVHPDYLELLSVPTSVPVCDGYRLKELCTINRLAEELSAGRVDLSKGCLFPLSVYHSEAFQFLGEIGPEHHVMAGDFYPLLGINRILPYGSPEMAVLPWGLTLNSKIKFKRTRSNLAWRLPPPSRFEYVYSAPDSFAFLSTELPALFGKNWILPASDPHLERGIAEFSPKEVIQLFPKALKFSPFADYATVDAAMRLSLGKYSALLLEEWIENLAHLMPLSEKAQEYVLRSRPSSQFWFSRKLQSVAKATGSGPRRRDPEFAFIIHPLSNRQLFQIPGMGLLKGLPDQARGWVERHAAKAPGFVYGHIDSVVSDSTGREVSGLIYCLPATPRALLEENVQTAYAKIKTICEHAADSGAKIIGLGAYTKIIGDGGASISRGSPIPVTTGNSLSAAATLWAVFEVTRKMGLITSMPGQQRMDGTAMVIGATGSVGKVSAKLLALAFKRLVLVAPRVERLQEVAREIREIAPDCEVIVSVSANDWAAAADVLVTATSAYDQEVVDVEQLQPGAIVCDCSRPLNFTIEAAMKRPDVLIMESGEVLLPGPAKVDCYIGLPDQAVWACLGETALLALSERYETFSLGRDLDWKKVKEIYKLAREHGVGLAAIRGHAGVITDKEIAITRELALKKRTRWS
jgi:predicted amino acid dehydrogenase